MDGTARYGLFTRRGSGPVFGRSALGWTLVWLVGLAPFAGATTTTTSTSSTTSTSIEKQPCSDSHNCPYPNNFGSQQDANAIPYQCPNRRLDNHACDTNHLYENPRLTDEANDCFTQPADFCPGGCWFSLIAIPDTQTYVKNWDKAVIFDCQTEWIKAFGDSLHSPGGTFYTLHEGDVVNKADDTAQWARAKRSMCVLTNATTPIPYALAYGNMDNQDNLVNGHQYFVPSDFAPNCGAGKTCTEFGYLPDTPNTIDFTYQQFDACGLHWMPMALRWKPLLGTTPVACGASQPNPITPLWWLQQKICQHADSRVMLLAHSFIDPSTAQVDQTGLERGLIPGEGGITACAGQPAGIPCFVSGQNQGENMWPGLVQPNRNILLAFNGHWFTYEAFHARIYRDTARHAAPVSAMFSNFQGARSGTLEQGTLEIVNVCPSTNQVLVRHYSPWTDTCFNGKVCIGGSNNNNHCRLDTDCPGSGSYCDSSQTFCAGGTKKGSPCKVNSDCPTSGGGTSTCDSNGSFRFQLGPRTSCVGGTNPGADCTSNANCANGGVCVVHRRICVGGATDHGATCSTNADCDGGTGTCTDDELEDDVDFSLTCGDGIVGRDAGNNREACDDPNCCSSDCTTPVASGTSCAAACAGGTCDGMGRCSCP